MRNNQPVHDREIPIRGRVLVSKTDATSRITYTNDAFVEVSGYTRAELIGEPQNIVRHPDMPSVVFEDMWSTLKQGYPWSGLVKNRTKDGGFYWVKAFVVPMFKDDRIDGYISVRTEADRAAINQANELYAQIRANAIRYQPLVPRRRPWSLTAIMAATIVFFMLLLVVQGLESLLHLPGYLIYITSAVGLLGGLVALTLVRRRFTQPVRTLLQIFRRLSTGDLNNEIPITGRDEIGQLNAALAGMQAQWRVVIDEIRLAATGVAQHGHELDQSMVATAAQVQAQQDNVLRISSAMEEVSVSISEVAQNAGAATHAARESANAIHQGREQADESDRSLRAVVQAMDESARSLKKMETALDEISSISNVIKEIADQTNLLALNAAIEAARAGEEGRGFAVVADEVRKLAERTGKSTHQIAAMLNDVHETAERVIYSVQGATSAVQTGQAQLQRTQQQFSSIDYESNQVIQHADHIAHATREQSAAAEDVARNMEQLSALSAENASSVGRAAKTAVALSHAADDLNAIVSRFGATARPGPATSNTRSH